MTCSVFVVDTVREGVLDGFGYASGVVEREYELSVVLKPVVVEITGVVLHVRYSFAESNSGSFDRGGLSAGCRIAVAGAVLEGCLECSSAMRACW